MPSPNQIINALSPLGYGLFNKQTRVSMNYLVYNEANVIADNIKYHATLGFDSFIVMDNGSNDGTIDIIKELQKNYPIHLMEATSSIYHQSECKTEMAITSRKVFGAHWSIANDADEFWLIKGSNIKPFLNKLGSTIYCKRYNVIPEKDHLASNKPYFLADLVVKRPIRLSSEDILNDKNVSIMMHKINGKVIANNYGLVRIHGGNHRASHWLNPFCKKQSDSIVLLHFPLQSKEKLFASLDRRRSLLKQKTNKMGNHYRRWISLQDSGSFEDELDLLAPDKGSIETLKKFGVLSTTSELLYDYKLEYNHFLNTLSKKI